jgi:hypothetical protein
MLYLCDKTIVCASFYGFVIWIWNCSNFVAFLFFFLFFTKYYWKWKAFYSYLWVVKNISTANNPSLVICVVVVDNCPIDLFSLSITWCVLLQYTASNYLFGIFKLVLHQSSYAETLYLNRTMRSSLSVAFSILEVFSGYSGLLQQ